MMKHKLLLWEGAILVLLVLLVVLQSQINSHQQLVNKLALHLDSKPAINVSRAFILPPPPVLENKQAKSIDKHFHKVKLNSIKKQEQVKIKKKQGKVSVYQSQQTDSQLKKAYQVLKRLESGRGPDIQIAWPSDSVDREWLSQRLYRCGVRLAKWKNGRLNVSEATSEPISGFVRVIQGKISANEQKRLAYLQGNGTPVRLFPRKLDAVLLVGMDRMLPIDFIAVKTLTAQYERYGESLKITNLTVNGATLSAIFTLLPSSGRCY